MKEQQPEHSLQLEPQVVVRPLRAHGGVRGSDTPRGSVLFEGKFGRIFRTLPAAQFDDDDLARLADKMTAEAETDPQTHQPTATPENEVDDEENQGIDAGYTYLGQFIDHDLTLDPMSSLVKQNDPEALTDFRTPRFDLDCVYGRGPDDQPYLYEDGGLRLKLGTHLTGAEDFYQEFASGSKAFDLPRHQSGLKSRARALIGDPRNDENVIVSQLQGIMLRFHNRMVDHLTQKNPNGHTPDFAEAQRLVRWHYQWVVLHDFLPTMVGDDPLDLILPHLKKHTSIYVDKPKLCFYKPRNEPFMPIEFAAAVYRFGHSMVRPLYRLSTSLVGKGPEKDPINGRLLIFRPDDDNKGLNGFRKFSSKWAIDWSLFFKMRDNSPSSGIRRVQKSYKIDSSLVDPLRMLPLSVSGKGPRSLALRNLQRGARMGLPNGQDVARYLDLDPIPDEQLRVGKATAKTTTGKPDERNPLLTEVSKKFADNAPLWYYILAEAQQAFKDDSTPIRLGKVGGRIVAEVFIGLLLGDSHSYLSQHPKWQPEEEFKRNGQFGMAELIRQAIQSK